MHNNGNRGFQDPLNYVNPDFGEQSIFPREYLDFSLPAALDKEKYRKQNFDSFVELKNRNIARNVSLIAKKFLIFAIVMIIVLIAFVITNQEEVNQINEFQEDIANATPTTRPTASPTDSLTFSPTISPTVNPTRSVTLSPTTSPTLLPTSIPTLSPTLAPTDAPSASPTPVPPNFFSFQNRENVEVLCAQGMDPESAVNGIFFTACVEGRANMCAQDTDNNTLGELIEEDCAGSTQCLCPDFVLFSPGNSFSQLGDLCGAVQANAAASVCSQPLDSIELNVVDISLDENSILSQMRDLCGSTNGEDAQVCLSQSLRVECEDRSGASDFILSSCSNGDPCDCRMNEIILGKSALGIEICSDADFEDRCQVDS